MQIVDRYQFIKDISQIVKSTTSTCIILISGSNGVGKFSAVKKLVAETFDNYNIVTLPSSLVSTDTPKVKNDYFFKVLDRIQNDYINFDSKKSKLSFANFIKRNKIYKEMIASYISTSITSDTFSKKGIAALFAKISLSKIYRVGSFSCLNMLNEKNANSILVGKKYLSHILHNDHIILELCAAQSIDFESLSVICNSIKGENGKGIVILEYDIDNNHYLEYDEFYKYLSTCCDERNLFVYPLVPLEFEDFYSVLCSKRNWNLTPYKTWIQKEYYLSSTKSINDFLDKLSAKYTSTELNIEHQFIISHEDFFSSASKTELFILCVLDIHGGNIKTNILYDFIHNQTICPFSIKEIEVNIKNMKQSYIINGNDQSVYFYHSSVHEAWKKHLSSLSAFPDCILLAADSCFNYYKIKLSNHNIHNNLEESKKTVYILLVIIMRYLPKRIIYIAQYLSLIAKEFTTPEDARYPIMLLLNELRKNKETNIETYYDIIELCCDMELYQEALQFWNDIQEIVLLPENYEFDKANYFFCKIHYLCDNHEKVIQHARYRLEHALTPESVLYYSIYLIITYRACNKYDDLQSVVLNIRNHIERYSFCIPYGLFLRISEVYKSRVEAIPDVVESVSFFLEHNLEMQAAKSQVSLSFLYSVTNNLPEAQKSLLYAKKFLNQRYQHILCNNEAAIHMLNGDFSSSVETLLNQAIMCSNSVFSNIVIFNNQMIYFHETNQFREMQYRIHMIEGQFNKLIDKHLIAVVSYNLSVFLKNIDSVKAEYYFAQAKKYREHSATLNTRLSETPPRDEHEAFFLNMPWHITMLSFWETDYI